ncbi:MAG: hypothetical protein DCF19_23710 [Pseudanabaena frigida]|uniref:Uncharacterized protein n=1 Tax=Pseudanabaena frigida TaxID=945775 RepID=A0A2W4W0E3_9CYAN|nr:MAG: hypothetical protein DCF19_23710 [Pseudanabaena frigida]
MKQKALKNPWVKLAIGLIICLAFLFFAIFVRVIPSGIAIAFVIGTFLILSGAVEILTGKDIIRRINQLQPIDLSIYISMYIGGLCSMLWLLDYFLPTGWQLALQIMTIVAFTFSGILYLIKKIGKNFK